MRLLLLFIAIPLIEIALFIRVGSFLGLWPTLLIVVLTAILGTYLVKKQGLQVLGQVQRSFNELRDPTEALAHGAMILFSGALLLTPGFFTDAVGFLLLVPAFRVAAFQFLRKRIKVSGFTATRRDPAQGQAASRTVIDGKYVDLDEQTAPRDGPSGWTRH
ncbi:FxsA family protein [Actibacterium sp. 188UL27-1]|uniref:FxsA family protein n=1 Tax=Actibacterium sp. 188UL27-1 TaxID=2786961 RepID=UPI0019561722|nr:FxsA family protein [Actibacterium sp. 188UL27-1]MBM7067242.1 FxsA family protein [Actibacterium sp. 188UL27-1]